MGLCGRESISWGVAGFLCVSVEVTLELDIWIPVPTSNAEQKHTAVRGDRVGWDRIGLGIKIGIGLDPSASQKYF